MSETVVFESPLDGMSPAAAQQIREQIARIPPQGYQGATPRLILEDDAQPMDTSTRIGTVLPAFGPDSALYRQATPIYFPESAAYRRETPPQPGTALVMRRPNAVYQTGGNRAKLVGDKNAVIEGYKKGSLCHTLVSDALQRAYMAIDLLDPVHANIIRARLAKAGVTNANASHADVRQITFKKAVSIALQAERWVYSAQAAAAKSMVKESKKCLHSLAGKRRRTTEEKEELYQKRYGMARGTRSERAARKYQKKAQALLQ